MSDYHQRSSRRYGDSSRDNLEEQAREDNPPNSRLFIIGGKNITEAEFRDAFGQFGKMEWLDIKKHRATGVPKGITYVKFSKTSEAAAALEELNGKSLGSDPRPLKVVIASSRSSGGEGGGRGALGVEDDDVKATRLFLVVPKTMTEEELREVFSEYGPIEHITMVRDKATGNSRGLAYVRFYRFSNAALAFENCDPSYKPKFAEPKPILGSSSGGRTAASSERGSMMSGHHGGNFGYGGSGGAANFGGVVGGGFGGAMGGVGSGNLPLQNNNMAAVFGMMQQSVSSVNNPTNSCRLRVLFNPNMSKDMFWSLFNIVPGLEHCELIEMTPEGAWGGVIYNNPRSAAWAIERIHGFEYPTGSKLSVSYDDMAPRGGGAFSMANGMPGMGNQMTANGTTTGGGGVESAGVGGAGKSMPSDILSLVNSIQAATEALKASGYGNVVGGGGGVSSAGAGIGSGVMSSMAMGGFGGSAEVDAQAVCSAKLPGRQAVLSANTRAEERLFFVLKDAREPPHPAIITDLFCRFGNLIDAYCLPRKKCGYARYASKENAAAAMAALDDQDLLGCRFKVVLADEEKSGKRARLD